MTESRGRSGPKAPLSCEACRRRKTRCVRPPDPETVPPEAEAGRDGRAIGTGTVGDTSSVLLTQCIPCRDHGLVCETQYVRKKRGPTKAMPGSIGAMSPVAQSLGDTTASTPRDPGQSSNARTHQPQYEGGTTGQVDVSDGRLVSETTYPFTTPLPQRAFSSPYQVTDANDRSTSSVRPSFHEAEQQHVSPRFDSNRHEHNPYGASSTTLQVKQYSAAGHTQTGNFSGIAGSSMSLEDHIDRESAIYIISLYFEYVHALIPCVHRPTFLERLRRRDDQGDPLFFALLLSILAATIVHLPKALLPFQNEAPIELANRCMRASRNACIDLYDPPSLDMITIRYFDSVFFSLTGKQGAWEVRGLSIQLGLHRESSYGRMDYVQTELRRRIFQTAFMADKSAACMQDQVIMLRGEDCDTRPPSELDDEYITPYQYLQQPEGTISKLAGHRAIAQIFGVIGEIISIRRALGRISVSMTPVMTLAQLRQLNSLDRRLTEIFQGMPGPLRLDETVHAVAPTFSSQMSEALPWETQAFTDLNQYFSDLINPEVHQVRSEAFLVMQGNIHVTRSIARLTLISCREEVLAASGPIGHPARTAAERVSTHSSESQDRRELVVSDLLFALQRIPIQALSVNSRSIVNKIRFVAVTLLDPIDGQVNVTAMDSIAAAKNQEALMSFLGILSNIEQALVDDYSQPPSDSL